MYLALLKRLQASRLPVNLTDPEDVRCAHAMHAAGMLAVLFMRPAHEALPAAQPKPQVARVLAITPQGRALLVQAPQPLAGPSRGIQVALALR